MLYNNTINPTLDIRAITDNNNSANVNSGRFNEQKNCVAVKNYYAIKSNLLRSHQ